MNSDRLFPITDETWKVKMGKKKGINVNPLLQREKSFYKHDLYIRSFSFHQFFTCRKVYRGFGIAMLSYHAILS